MAGTTATLQRGTPADRWRSDNAIETFHAVVTGVNRPGEYDAAIATCATDSQTRGAVREVPSEHEPEPA